MLKKNNRGFSLIELIVVIAIIGILVMLAAPKFIGYTERARTVRIQNDVKVVEGKIAEEYIKSDYKFDKGINGKTSEELNDKIGESTLYSIEGKVQPGKVESGDYKVVSNLIRTEARTKLKGDFYANANGKVYYVDKKASNNSGNEDGEDDNALDVKNCPTTGYIPVDITDEIKASAPKMFLFGGMAPPPLNEEMSIFEMVETFEMLISGGGPGGEGDGGSAPSMEFKISYYDKDLKNEHYVLVSMNKTDEFGEFSMNFYANDENIIKVFSAFLEANMTGPVEEGSEDDIINRLISEIGEENFKMFDSEGEFPSLGILETPNYVPVYDSDNKITICKEINASNDNSCIIEEVDFLEGMIFDDILFSGMNTVNFKEKNGSVSKVFINNAGDNVTIESVEESAEQMTVSGITFRERGTINSPGSTSYYGIEEDTNNLYTWGHNGAYNTGHHVSGRIEEPRILLEKVVQFKNTGNASFAVDEYGNLWSWGFAGDYGILGTGKINVIEPEPQYVWGVTANSGVGIDKIFTFGYSVFARKTNGEMIAWGQNATSNGDKSGILGIGSTDKYKANYTHVKNLDGKTVSDMFMVVGETYFILDNGEVYATGHNEGFRLGIENTDMNILSPEKMLNLNNITSMQRNTSDYNNTIALDANKDMWVWGETKQDTWMTGTEPVRVSSVFSEITNIKDVKGDFILREDGTVWSWSNKNYDFGHTGPTKVLENVRKLFYRGDYYAILETGKLWGWGKNHHWNLLIQDSVEEPIQLGLIERCEM